MGDLDTLTSHNRAPMTVTVNSGQIGHDLTCPVCGTVFTTLDRRRRYCGSRCQRRVTAASTASRQAKHRQRHPDRDACRQTLKNAILLGKIRRVTRCEQCGERGQIEAHHEDYSRPFYVEWLCKTCHEAGEPGTQPRLVSAAATR